MLVSIMIIISINTGFVATLSFDLSLAFSCLELNLTKNHSNTEFYGIQKGQTSCSEFLNIEMELQLLPS